MVIDTSALIAIVLGEPEAPDFERPSPDEGAPDLGRLPA